jgi:thymidylate kinase
VNGAASIVDAAASGRVLVFGSPPPGGRDLDTLVASSDAEPVRRALAAAGFVSAGGSWARFRDCRAEEAELATPADWGLPAAEADALFAEARPLDGFERLVRPSPRHELLVLAKLLSWTGSFPEKRRARLEAAATDDPDAWTKARAAARAWKVERELAELAVAHAAREPAPGRRRLPRPRRPLVVALSGIDGSGKSSQARALVDALEALGHDAAIEWAPIASNPWLDAIAQPVKRVLGRSRRFRPGPPSEESPASGLERTPGTVLREQSPLVTSVWATLVSLANALWQARVTARHTLAGRVVIFDRYELDSVVRLRFMYGAERSYALQRRLIRLCSPRPVAAFFLDIDAETSLARKDDRWSLEDLQTQVHLYREEYARLDVTRLDGSRPREELCAEIAEAVWRRLS